MIRGDFAALWSFARRGEPWCVLRDGRCCGLLRGCEIIPLPITYSPPRRKPGSIASSHELFTGLAGKALRLFDAPVSVDRWVPAFAGNATSALRPCGAQLPIFSQALKTTNFLKAHCHPEERQSAPPLVSRPARRAKRRYSNVACSTGLGGEGRRRG